MFRVRFRVRVRVGSRRIFASAESAHRASSFVCLVYRVPLLLTIRSLRGCNSLHAFILLTLMFI